VTAFSQNKDAATQPDTLVYNYPLNRPVSYRETTKVIQTMDINGQSMGTNVSSYAGLTLKSLGASDSNTKIEVKVDTMASTVDSPAGVSGGPIPAIAGKTYNILISQDGKVVDNSEAKNITYATGEGATGDAAQLTEGFFPVLPSGSIKPGTTWTTSDSINSQSSSMTTTGTVKADNTFDGYEIYNGVNCAKISSVLSGIRIMTLQTQGMDIKMSGPYTGSITFYFAPSAGIFIKRELSMKITGTMDITTPDVMSFPLVMEINVTTEVIK
jgi:hypothetical protein